MNQIAVIMTTIKKDSLLMKCLPTFLNKDLTIYLLDQGRLTPQKVLFYNELRNQGHQIYCIEKDIGLSAARNFLISKITEPYFFIVDDDVELLSNPYDLLHHFDENPAIGIVGGCLFNVAGNVEHHYEYALEIRHRILYLKKSPNIDLVLNFFIARTEIFKDIQWDEQLQMVEHSITKDTPIIIKDGWNNISIIPIDKLFYNSINTPNRTQYLFNKQSKIRVWTDRGWQKIQGIFRHKINENIRCLSTNEGYIECSKDHSLIIKNKKVKGSELKIGQPIELCKYPKLSNTLQIDKDWAWLLGLFLAEGCYRKEFSDCNIANQDVSLLKKAKLVLQKFGIDSYIVYNMKTQNRCNYLKMKPFKLIDSYFSNFYMGKDKIIPSFIYKFDKNSRLEFFRGFHDGDGTKATKLYRHCKIFSQKSQTIIQGLWYLLSDIYPNKNINSHKNIWGSWFVSNFKQRITPNKNIIKKIETKRVKDYIYDIETENHHFCGGIGNVNLHNTDYFLRFKALNKWTVIYDRALYGNHYSYKFRPIDYRPFRAAKTHACVALFHKKWNIINTQIEDTK
jgi:hypothetical protein